MNIAIVSGEISGDLIGGALARELHRLAPDADLWGLGSSAMRAADVELLADSTGWGVISITQAIGKYPLLRFRILPLMVRALRRRRPDVVVLIDFGAFNKRVAKEAKRLGLKVCWYFPPGAAWRRTGNKGANLAGITDLLIVPFAWSAERLRGLGAKAVEVGHPLIERTVATLSREEFARQFGIDPHKPIVGLLPGSRLHEIEYLMPVLLEAARRIQQEVREVQFVIGVAPNISPERMTGYLHRAQQPERGFREAWQAFMQELEDRLLRPMAKTVRALKPHSQRKLVTVEGAVVPEETLRDQEEATRRSKWLRSQAERALPPTVLVQGLTYDVMAHSDVLLTCSGTATLEAAAFETPMVILYRFSKVMELEARLLGLKKKIKMIGLPNILAERMIVPELIQHDASPEAIAEHTVRLLNDVTARYEARQALHAVREMLGSPGASARAARWVLELAGVTSETELLSEMSIP